MNNEIKIAETLAEILNRLERIVHELAERREPTRSTVIHEAPETNPRMRTHLVRISAEYRESLWVKWPTTADWPAVMDLYEAAAYLRVCYNTLRAACHPARDRKAKLRHQRIGASIRVTKAALDKFGLVEERA